MKKLNKTLQKTVTINGKELVFKIGRFAEQATAAVLIRSGDTVVHVTVVAGNQRPDIDYFPLFVEYQEKLYASGIIKGSRWVKREGRPSDEAILKARLIDRSIRPLFPPTYKNEIQVVATVLSYDQQNDPDILALCATSAALAISEIPWQGPIAAVRVGLDEKDRLIINPTRDQRGSSKLDLVVSGSDQAVVMVEANAREVTEDQSLKALQKGHDEIKKIIAVINQLVKEVGIKKQAIPAVSIDPDLKKQVLAKTQKSIDDLIDRLKSDASLKDLFDIETACAEELPDLDKNIIKETINDYLKTTLRNKLFSKKIRPDGRQLDEIRPLSSEVAILPRTHGSGLFRRGSTQALTITTLGSPSLEQLIEGLEGESSKRYIHHYYFPPYSVGETGRMGWPSRREVGHGALAERALEPVVPDEDTFPYTIRVVSEVMSSNGSTSMASVCGSTLSLMDAGVPLKKPVAGISMGLMVKDKDYLVLTDILGLEDHLGDMDFKIAGTKDGLTALQMDIKISGITFDILKVALEQAKAARLTILDNMIKTIAKPNDKVSPFAPKITTLNIPQDKIGELIGPGGRIIRQIIKETECQVDVDDDGRVIVSGKNPDKLQQAVNWIDGLTREIQVGEEFDGQVVRLEPFGVFVEILPGRDGMVHVSKLSTGYVQNPKDVVNIGDTLHVRVVEIDDMGRVNLSALTPEQEEQARQNRPPRQPGPPRRQNHRHRSDRSRPPRRR